MAATAAPSGPWAPAILKGIGAPVTPRTTQDLFAWSRAEGGSASNNPFNTTQGGYGGSNYNSVGVKNYATPQTGVNATLATLRNGRYGGILSALRTGGDPSAFASAVGSSPWGTSGSTLANVLKTKVLPPTSLNTGSLAPKPVDGRAALVKFLLSNSKSLMSGGFGANPTNLFKALSTPTPSSVSPAATAALTSPESQTIAKGYGGGFLPQGAAYTQDRADQGRDLTTTPGGAIVSPGVGEVVRIASDPNGFGTSYPIIYYHSGPYAGKYIYVGHTKAAVKVGQTVYPGDVISHTGTTGNEPWNGNATQPGWAEIGFAPGGNPGSFGQPTPF